MSSTIGDFVKFIRDAIPDDVNDLDFIFKEDFNGDGDDEIVIGYHQGELPQGVVLYFYRSGDKFCYEQLFPIDDDVYLSGFLLSAFAEDTNGDGRPELILGIGGGTSHAMEPIVFHWVDGKPCLAFSDGYAYNDARLAVTDVDNDKIFELVLDYNTWPDYVNEPDLWLERPVLRGCGMYKWDGATYTRCAWTPDLTELQYRIAIQFVTFLWRQEYYSAYLYIDPLSFMGLDGLLDHSREAFCAYAKHQLRPTLMADTETKPLSTEKYCIFYGENNMYLFNFTMKGGAVRISRLFIMPNPREEDDV